MELKSGRSCRRIEIWRSVNRTNVELKLGSHMEPWLEAWAVNRTNVELKSTIKKFTTAPPTAVNRTNVELKCGSIYRHGA